MRYSESQSDAQFSIFLATHQPCDFSPIERTAFAYYQRLNGALDQEQTKGNN